MSCLSNISCNASPSPKNTKAKNSTYCSIVGAVSGDITEVSANTLISDILFIHILDNKKV